MSNGTFKIFSALLGMAIVSGGPFITAQNTGHAAQQNSNQGKEMSTAKAGQNGQNEGQRVFTENCSRCHNAPQGFSPKIAGTVSRHMRLRANLSAEDERALLRFFNP